MKKFTYIILSLLITPFFSHAYTIGNINVEPLGDFVLEPAKVEVNLNAGEKMVRDITVTSRTKGSTAFKIETEDMVGTRDINTPVKLLGSEKSQYSFKDYLKVTAPEFKLDFGQKITIPVTIQVPKNMAPGGYYSVLLVSNAPSKETLKTQTGAKTVSRLGAEFFVRVNGEAKTVGELSDFTVAKADDPNKTAHSFFTNGPFQFQILFENTGNVHLTPYGDIVVKNIWGGEVGQVKLDAYFALPDSLRYRSVFWQNDFMLGRYTATLNLHRSYGDLTDTKTIAFWVIPWKIILAIFGSIFLIVLLVSLFFRFFQLKKN